MVLSLTKYFILFQILMAAYALYKMFITPLEEKITIQLSIFYLLIIWAIFGMIYVTKSLDKDLKIKEEE